MTDSRSRLSARRQTPAPDVELGSNPAASELSAKKEDTKVEEEEAGEVEETDGGVAEASSEEAPQREADRGNEEQQEQQVPTRRRQAENEVSEVEIPNVGRIMVRADADGYNEEVSARPSKWRTVQKYASTLFRC